MAVYRELLAAEPAHVEARLRLARLLAQLEEHEQALVLLAETLRNAPDQTEFLVLRGGIYGHLRRYEEADGDLRRVLRLYPSHAPAHLELGRLLWRKGLAGEAATYFRRALEFQPESARTCTTWATPSIRRATWRVRRPRCERALELDPRDAKAHHLLGRVFDRLGRPDEARDDVRALPGARRRVIRVVVGELGAGSGGRGAPAGRCDARAGRRRRRPAG